MNTWILCPNLWGARLFATDNFDEVPRFLRELPRPKIQLRHEDFDTDEDIPELTEDPRDHEREVQVAQQFMGDLSAWLENECAKGSFGSIILCAESQLLGILKEKLGKICHQKVIGTVNEDLYEVNETDLADYVRAFKNKRPGEKSPWRSSA